MPAGEGFPVSQVGRLSPDQAIPGNPVEPGMCGAAIGQRAGPPGLPMLRRQPFAPPHSNTRSHHSHTSWQSSFSMEPLGELFHGLTRWCTIQPDHARRTRLPTLPCERAARPVPNRIASVAVVYFVAPCGGRLVSQFARAHSSSVEHRLGGGKSRVAGEDTPSCSASVCRPPRLPCPVCPIVATAIATAISDAP